MYNRTQQLRNIAYGLKEPIGYNKDYIIVFNDFGKPSCQPEAEDRNDDDGLEEGFEQYMCDVQAVRELIGKVDEGAKGIYALIDLSASAVTTDHNADVSTKLNQLIESTNDFCSRCKVSITALETEKDKGTATESRMRSNAYNVCLKHFQSAVKRYQDAQITFKKAIKERTARQVQLIYPELDASELDRMMAPGNAQQVLEQAARSAIIGGGTLIDAVNNIQSKYNDVLALEDSVEELHQMMIELAGIVRYQGELIDQVEYNTMKAVEYTEKANVELVKAQDLKRRRNKLIMYITGGATVGTLMIVVPLVLKVA
ncbi:SNARE domain containing protein [Babesia caballi]|uniref:SNARE domain containing protein n=1 Tax=Babesia caballi TaxID=5871 RepID=A0AAV4LP18_BABCB|nr:SNARE domain containing protein [Babesia caballi]